MESMEQVGLDPNSKKKVGKYSLGMRQRLGIAKAIMENPDIVILDEPMNGLDNQGAEDVREINQSFLATEVAESRPISEEAPNWCDSSRNHEKRSLYATFCLWLMWKQGICYNRL